MEEELDETKMNPNNCTTGESELFCSNNNEFISEDETKMSRIEEIEG